MKAVPIELKAANEYVAQNHRHHSPVYRNKFRIACTEHGRICGVIQCGRPVSRHLDDGKTIEVTRCCTDGTANACSFLYGRAAGLQRRWGMRESLLIFWTRNPGYTCWLLAGDATLKERAAVPGIHLPGGETQLHRNARNRDG